jgi:hypothetical protein
MKNYTRALADFEAAAEAASESMDTVRETLFLLPLEFFLLTFILFRSCS